MRFFLKNTIYLVLLFTGILSAAQEIVLPQLPTPEKAFYRLLEEDKVTNLKMLDGHVKQVTKTFRTYKNKVVNLSEKQVTIMDSVGVITDNYYLFENEKLDNFEAEPTQIKDTINGFERTRVFMSDYETLEYLYKNDKILKRLKAEENLYVWEEIYTYDKKGRLTAKHTYDYVYLDEEEHKNGTALAAKTSREVEVVTYNNEVLANKKIYLYYEDVIDIYTTTYQYNTNKTLKTYTLSYDNYNAENLDFEKSLDQQNYDKLEKSANTTKRFIGSFKYHTDNKIAEFELEELGYADALESYLITYEKNKMLVKASFNKFEEDENINTKTSSLKLEYEYTFDSNKNPIHIKSYYWYNDTKFLDKETIVEIEYY